MPSFLSLTSVVTLLAIQGIANPLITFPINAQLPPVAYIGENYSFTFSADTFASRSTLSYTIAGNPSWLSLDAATRTLNGTPLNSDQGDSRFNLTATDAHGNLSAEVVLVVRDRRTVTINQEVFISKLRKAGAVSAPSILLVRSTQSINLDLGPGIFDAAGTSVHYYAVSADNTPLPAWLSFDPSSVTLSGAAPILNPEQSPQYCGFKLVASQIVGFAEAVIHLEISITKRILSFSNPLQTYTIAPNTKIQIPPLLGVLQRDAAPVARSTIKSISTNQPSWLVLDSNDLSFSGRAPADLKETTFRVTVVDDEGNITAADIDIKSSASDVSSTKDVYLGIAIVVVGQWFSYTLQDSSTGASTDTVKDDFGDLSSWLRFVQSNLTLQGWPPTTVASGDYNVTFTTVRPNSNVVSVNRLTLQIRNTTNVGVSTTASLVSSSTASATGFDKPSTHDKSSRRRLVLALGITLPLVFVLLVSLAVFVCFARRRHKKKDTAIDTGGATIDNVCHESTSLHPDSAIDVSNPTIGKPYKSALQGPSPLAPQIDFNRPLRSAPTRPRPQSQTGSLETRSSWSQILETPRTHSPQFRDDSLGRSEKLGPQEVHPALRPLSMHNRPQSLRLNVDRTRTERKILKPGPSPDTTSLDKPRSKLSDSPPILLPNISRTRPMHRHRRTATQRMSISKKPLPPPQRDISHISHRTPDWYRDGLSTDPFSDSIWTQDDRITSAHQEHGTLRLVPPDDRVDQEDGKLRYQLESSEIIASADPIKAGDFAVQESDPISNPSLRTATSAGDGSLSKVLL